MELANDCVFTVLTNGNVVSAPSGSGVTHTTAGGGSLDPAGYYEYYLVAYKEGAYSASTTLFTNTVGNSSITFNSIPAAVSGNTLYLVRYSDDDGTTKIVAAITGTSITDTGTDTGVAYNGAFIPLTLSRINGTGYVLDSPNGLIRVSSVVATIATITTVNATNAGITNLSFQTLSQSRSFSGSSTPTAPNITYMYDSLSGTAQAILGACYYTKSGTTTAVGVYYSVYYGGTLKMAAYVDGRHYSDRVSVGTNSPEAGYRGVFETGSGGSSSANGSVLSRGRLDVGTNAGSSSDYRGGTMACFKSNSGTYTTISCFSPGGNYVSMYANDNGDFAVGPFAGNSSAETISVNGRPSTTTLNGKNVLTGNLTYGGSAYAGLRLEQQADATVAPLTHNLIDFILQGYGWNTGNGIFGGIGYNGEFFVGGTSPSSCNGVFDANGYLTAKRGMFSQKVTKGVVSLTDGSTINIDASLGNKFRVTIAGNRTIAAPTNPSDGQEMTIRIKQDTTGSRTITWNSVFRFPGGTTPTLTTTLSKTDYLAFEYNSTDTKWDFLGMQANL